VNTVVGSGYLLRHYYSYCRLIDHDAINEPTTYTVRAERKASLC